MERDSAPGTHPCCQPLSSRTFVCRALIVVIAATVLSQPRPVSAYSVLAHESMVDSAWDDVIVPMIKARFPGSTPEVINRARSYAYGGCVVQDLGYYPFGSHFFTNLLHYVRSGDFVETMIRDARDVNEFAFALGTLAHYTADTTGHPLAINRAVPIVYPKLRAKFGDEVTYFEDPKRHVMMEFAFDVVQVAHGAYLPEAFHNFIGFEVATDLLTRSFREVYGLDMDDVFASKDLAIGTFRYAVSTTIPQMTQVAWEKKRDEIEQLSPHVQRNAFVYTYTRAQYEEDFGNKYQRPGPVARFFVWVVRILPKIGPLQALAFKTPTPAAEQLFTESFRTARDRFRTRLVAVRANRLNLSNADFDTGASTRRGEYPLADETYDDLLARVSKAPASLPSAMRADIVRFYGAVDASTARNKKERKRLQTLAAQLAALNPVASLGQNASPR